MFDVGGVVGVVGGVGVVVFGGVVVGKSGVVSVGDVGVVDGVAVVCGVLGDAGAVCGVVNISHLGFHYCHNHTNKQSRDISWPLPCLHIHHNQMFFCWQLFAICPDFGSHRSPISNDFLFDLSCHLQL